MALRLSEGLGLARRDNFDFDSVRIFAVQRVVVRTTCKRVLGFIESRVVVVLHPRGHFIDVCPGLALEGEMIQADPFSVVSGCNVLWRLSSRAASVWTTS